MIITANDKNPLFERKLKGTRFVCQGQKKATNAKKELLKNYPQRAVMVFSSMNILIEAILDFAVPMNDSLLDPKGKKA